MAYRGPQEQIQQGIVGPNTGNPGGAHNMMNQNPNNDPWSFLRSYFGTDPTARVDRPAGPKPETKPQAPGMGMNPIGLPPAPANTFQSLGPAPNKPSLQSAQVTLPGHAPTPTMGQPNQVQPDGSVPKPTPTPNVNALEEMRRSLVGMGGGLPPTGAVKPQDQPFPGQGANGQRQGQYPGAPRYTPPTVDNTGQVTNSDLLNFNLPRHYNQQQAPTLGASFDPMTYLSTVFGQGRGAGVGGGEGGEDIQALINRLLGRGGG